MDNEKTFTYGFDYTNTPFVQVNWSLFRGMT